MAGPQTAQPQAALLERRAAAFALVAALLVFLLKAGAFFVTGSVALLSDAGESVVNIAGALAVIISVSLSQRPADYRHPYGHHKAQYLSSAFEGTLILLAAGMILVTSVQRLFDPPTLERVAVGVAIASVALIVNGVASMWLAGVARRTRSAALAANARHLLTDVWTSIGVIVSVIVVSVSGFALLDPVIGTLVALNVVREGWRVTSSSLSYLMDARLPDREEALILEVLNGHPGVLGYHRLRSRRGGRERFAEVDIFVRPEMSVAESHEIATSIERELRSRLPDLSVTIHVEPYVIGTRDRTQVPSEEYDS